MYVLKQKVADVNGWLLASLFFLIPLKMIPAYVIGVIMLILWMFEGNLQGKWLELKRNPIFWLFQAYFWILALSLLWTEDLDSGLRIVGKHSLFLLSPIFLTIAQRSNARRYIAFFLASVGMCVAFAYYNWLRMHYFGGLPLGVSKRMGDTAPFVNRVIYSPILAFAAYLVAEKAIQARGQLQKMLAYTVFFAAILGNLIFSEGRTGHVAFIGMIVLLMCRHLKRSPMKAIAASLLITAAFVTIAYFGSTSFRQRADLASNELVHYRETAGQPDINHSSTGLRLTFWANSLQLFLENPLIGVGVGDFASSYEEVNRKNTPNVAPTLNPHNQYFYTLTTTGVLGGIVLLAMYLPPGLWVKDSTELAHVKSGLAVLFLLISMAESYILIFYTGMMFILFSCVIYVERNTTGDSPK